LIGRRRSEVEGIGNIEVIVDNRQKSIINHKGNISMIHSIQDFSNIWSQEIENTQKVFKHLTDKSLSQIVSPDVRTLGRLAWHITTTIPEMMGRTGLSLIGPDPDSPVPATAKQVFNAYNEAAISLLDQVKAAWTDETLEQTDDMYGQVWKRGFSLQALIHHQIHHRGEMIALMRVVGLNVPGLYGPTREEWAQWGMKPPAV
jgi:uncharacterized damage-inducible protein DinB